MNNISNSQTDNQVVDTVDEMSFILTMRDGSRKLVRFKLKDARVTNDETSLELSHQGTKRSDLPYLTDIHKQVKITFNYAAFEIEIIELQD